MNGSFSSQVLRSCCCDARASRARERGWEGLEGRSGVRRGSLMPEIETTKNEMNENKLGLVLNEQIRRRFFKKLVEDRKMMAVVDNPANATEWALAEMINQPKLLQQSHERIGKCSRLLHGFTWNAPPNVLTINMFLADPLVAVAKPRLAVELYQL
ncbi:hypothetical protein JHK85_032474 [Glycine max]|nr:hypothetical protein JHK85_032474 [Glycine max]